MGLTTITPRPKRRSSSFTSNLFRQRTDGFEGDGFKQSGVGGELGPDALDHYTELKDVLLGGGVSGEYTDEGHGFTIFTSI